MEPIKFPAFISAPASRVSLRAATLEDVRDLWSYIQSDRKNPNRRNGWPSIHNLESLAGYISSCDISNPRSGEIFYLIENAQDEFVGTIHVHSIAWSEGRVEIGYAVHHRFEGCGYVSAAIRLLEVSLQDSGFVSIQISLPIWNLRSRAVAQRNGYTLIRAFHLNRECTGCDECSELYEKRLPQPHGSNAFTIA